MNEACSPYLPHLESRAITDLGRGADSDELTLMRRQLAAAVGASCPLWLVNHRDDIVQNAMMAVLRQQERRRGEAHFSASYLKKVAFTATIDEIRRRRSRGEVPLETEESDETSFAAVSAGPERQAISRELAVALRQCLEELAPPRRMAVNLHLMGYKVPQMAKKMGWTRKQAENLVYRGLKDLREHLTARGLQP